jgi:hypothetical protein
MHRSQMEHSTEEARSVGSRGPAYDARVRGFDATARTLAVAAPRRTPNAPIPDDRGSE